MDTPTNTAEGSAPAPQSTPPTSETPRPSAQEIVAALTPEQRRLIATGKIEEFKATLPAAAPATTPAEPAPSATPEPTALAAAEAAPAGTDPAQATPDADPGEGAEGDPGATAEPAGSKGKRFRVSDERDQALIQFAKANNMTIQEAALLLAKPAGNATPAPASSAQAAAPAPEPVVDATAAEFDAKLTETQKRIEKLTADRKKANEDLENEKVLELNDAIADAKADAKLLTFQKEQHLQNREREIQRSNVSRVNASRDRAFTEFPVFANPDSLERMALDSYANRLLNDPKRGPALQADPNWPEIVAREFAALKGIKPTNGVAAGTAPAAAPKPAVTPKPATLFKPQPTQVGAQASGAKLLTGASGMNPAAPSAATLDDLKKAIDTDPKARRQIVREIFTAGGRR